MAVTVMVKSFDGISLVPVEAYLMGERKVMLEGEINPQTARDFFKEITFLNREDSTTPIDVVIDSPGGDIDSGMIICDVIEGSKAPIRMYCVGSACSMAAIIFSYGKYGRYMLPHAKLLLHEPRIESTGIAGSTSSMMAISKSLVETKRQMDQILADRTGRDIKEIEEATSYEHQMTAKEALDFGICDQIISFDQIGKIDLK